MKLNLGFYRHCTLKSYCNALKSREVKLDCEKNLMFLFLHFLEQCPK